MVRKEIEGSEGKDLRHFTDYSKASFPLRKCRQHGDVDADGGNDL